MRTCVITKNKAKQNELIKITIHPSGKVNIFTHGNNLDKQKGRSIYLTNDKKVIEEFIKRGNNFFSNFVKRKVDKEEFEKVKEILTKTQCLT